LGKRRGEVFMSMGRGSDNMKILFEIGHPAHVHLFKYVFRGLEKDGHEIKIMVKEREGVVTSLLKHYGFNYSNLQTNSPHMIEKAKNMILNEIKIFNIARKFKPDIFVSVASPFSAHVSTILGKPHICLTDTEDATLQLKLMVPFTRSILTPDCFLKRFPEKKHIRYPGYHELAYLHPNWFHPDPSILDYLGVEKGKRYVIMRFSAWDASHDIGQHGFQTDEERLALVKELEKYAKVFISSEIPLKGELEKRRIKIPIHRIHDALYYASLYVGDGHKMATEAGILGTPAVLVSTRWDKMGYTTELYKKYHLIEAMDNSNRGMERALELLKAGMKNEWKRRANLMLNDKIDVTGFLLYFIENYPESHKDTQIHKKEVFKRFNIK